MKKESIKILERKNIARNKQFAYILVRNEEFQEQVREFRREWSIPEDGFKSEKEFKRYAKILCNEFRISSKITKRENYKIHHRLYKGEVFDFVFERDEILIIKVLTTAIHILFTKLNLMDNMTYFVYHHILFNGYPDDEKFLHLPRVSQVENSISEQYVSLSISIDDKTTLEEIKAVWKEIMSQQTFMSAVNSIYGTKYSSYEEIIRSYKRKPQLRTLNNFERDELIYEFKKAGMTCTLIAKEMKARGFKGISYDYVSKVVARYKKRIEGRKAKN